MGRVLTRGELIADIRRVAKLVGHAPTYSDYEEHGTYSTGSVSKYVAPSWPDAIRECGLIYRRTTGKYKAVTNDEIEKDLRRVMTELGKPPTRREYMKYGKYDDGTVANRTEAKRWPEALVFFLKIDIEEAKRYGRTSNRGVYKTREECLEELRGIAQKLGRAPSEQEAIAHRIDMPRLRRKVSRSYEEILKAAGLNQMTRRRSVLVRKMSDEQMLDDVLRVARQLGRVPTSREYDQLGRISDETVAKRFGSWKEVKNLVAARMNKAQAPKEMPDIHDPVREWLKSESTEAVRNYFKSRNPVERSTDPQR